MAQRTVRRKSCGLKLLRDFWTTTLRKLRVLSKSRDFRSTWLRNSRGLEKSRGWKLEIRFLNGCFYPKQVRYVRRPTVQTCSSLSKLNVRRFRIRFERFMVKLRYEKQSWSSWYWHANHDLELEIRYLNGCFHPQQVRFVRRPTVQICLSLTKLDVRCSRIKFYWLLVKLLYEMRSRSIENLKWIVRILALFEGVLGNFLHLLLTSTLHV